MKTPTAASKPARRHAQAKPTITPPALEILPFTVSTEWVNVTIPIAKEDAVFLDSQNEYIRRGIGSDVNTFTAEPRDELKYGRDIGWYKELVSKAGRQPEGETRPWVISMKLLQWQAVEALAPILDTTPGQLVRAAITKRISQIRQYRAQRARKSESLSRRQRRP